MFATPLRWLRRTLIAVVMLIVVLLLPSAYIEFFCTDDVKNADYSPIITKAEFQRAEANSYLTYPEWHIVYAYEGLAKVLETGDEHEFNYSASISGFWRSACALNKTSQQHGAADFITRGIIHIIGISFTIELGFKALYEETLGHLFTLIRGPVKSPQDAYAAEMARDFSNFLQQTPWYDYDFHTATTNLWNAPMRTALRGWERRLALGGEWKAKAAYAVLIADASNAAGPVVSRIRLVVTDIDVNGVSQIEGVSIIEERANDIIIEANRYRKLTITMQEIARKGGQILEIAGNDDILVSAIRSSGVTPQSITNGTTIAELDRDGFPDTRLLVSAKVSGLSKLFAEFEQKGLELEHVYDY